MPIESTAVPVDIDRQCMPEKAEKACREGLLCIRLFIPLILSDGGLSEGSTYTCHPSCQDDAGCPTFATIPFATVT